MAISRQNEVNRTLRSVSLKVQIQFDFCTRIMGNLTFRRNSNQIRLGGHFNDGRLNLDRLGCNPE